MRVRGGRGSPQRWELGVDLFVIYGPESVPAEDLLVPLYYRLHLMVWVIRHDMIDEIEADGWSAVFRDEARWMYIDVNGLTSFSWEVPRLCTHGNLGGKDLCSLHVVRKNELYLQTRHDQMCSHVKDDTYGLYCGHDDRTILVLHLFRFRDRLGSSLYGLFVYGTAVINFECDVFASISMFPDVVTDLIGLFAFRV